MQNILEKFYKIKLINSNRSEVRRFTENRENLDQFNKYVFIDSEKVIGVLGKSLHFSKEEKSLN